MFKHIKITLLIWINTFNWFCIFMISYLWLACETKTRIQSVVKVMHARKKLAFQSLLKWGPCPKFEIDEFNSSSGLTFSFFGALVAQFVLVLAGFGVCGILFIWSYLTLQPVLLCLCDLRNFCGNAFAENLGDTTNLSLVGSHKISFSCVVLCVHYKSVAQSVLVWFGHWLVGWLPSLWVQSTLPRLKNLGQLDDLKWTPSTNLMLDYNHDWQFHSADDIKDRQWLMVPWSCRGSRWWPPSQRLARSGSGD